MNLSRVLVVAALCGPFVLGHAQVTVSSSGLPSYGHPIQVPPGISGMAPQLSLAYAGGGVNGPLGHGWSLQGLSMVTRCAATKFTDNVSRGVRFDANDKLCLDGQRLIQTNAAGEVTPAPVYGADGKLLSFPQSNDARGLASGYREYRTEKDSQVRVRAYGLVDGNEANGPAYFRVWTKAGQLYEYGATPSADANTNAAIRVSGKTMVMVWAVARIRDSVGNYIDFKYRARDTEWGSGRYVETEPGMPAQPHQVTSGREWNILEIQYTGNGTQVPSNKVIFNYLDRIKTTDRAEAYQLGAKNLSIERLDNIETYVNSPNSSVLGKGPAAVLAKRLRLSYDTSGETGRARLTTISECAMSGTTEVCMPPTSFEYSAGAGDVFEPKVEFNLKSTQLRNNIGSTGVEVADFNGDGKSDILRWTSNPGNNRIYLNRGNGQFDELPLGSGPGQFGVTGLLDVLNSADGCVASLVADFNADGIPDIFRYYAIGADGLSCGNKPTFLYIGRGDGGFDRRTVSLGGASLLKNKITTLCPITGPDPCMLPQADTFYVLDVDGDGLMDIVKTWLPARPSNATADACASTTCTRVYRGDGNGVFTELTPAPAGVSSKSLYQWPSEGGNAALAQQRFVVDVDGDGMVDIVLGKRPQGAGSQMAWRSLGKGDFEPYATPNDIEDCKHRIDFNGDGRSECVFPDGLSPLKNRLSVSTGAELHHIGGFDLTDETLKSDSAGIRVVDFNGDGRGDILRWTNLGTGTKLFISQGDGTFVTSTSFNLNDNVRRLVTSGGSYDFVQGDFLGNGSLSILRLVHSPNTSEAETNQIYVRSNPTPPDQLQSVISPSGIKTSLIYGSLANPEGQQDKNLRRYVSDREETGWRANYPLVDLTIPGPVVVSMDVDSGVGASRNRIEYAYRGMKAAVDGRGMLGFRRTVQQSTAPNGAPLSVWTDYLIDEPYVGVARRTETRLGPWTQPTATVISSTVNTYCDKTSPQSPADSDTTGVTDSFTDTAPCSTNARVRKPYLRRVVEQGNDLDGSPLPSVTTINTYNHFGDPLNIVVTTRATVAGIADQVFTKATANQFCDPGSTLPGGGACPNNTTGDNWILGRLTRSSVTNTVPNLMPSLQASPGNAPRATDTTGGLSVQVTAEVAFGSVAVGQSPDRPVVITNNGSSPLGVTPPTASSSDRAEYEVAGHDCPTSLTPSTSCTITVRFKPLAAGELRGNLTVVTGAGPRVVALVGTGLKAALSINPAGKLTYASLQVGQSSAPTTMTLQNTGNGVATGLAITVPTGFTLNPGTCGTTLPGPGSCDFSVAFAPQSAGVLSGPVRVTAALTDVTASRDVEGEGVPAGASIQTPVDFGGRLILQSPVEQSVEIRNNGIGPLVIQSAPGAGSVTGAGFGFSSTNCGNSVAVGDKCVVWVKFEPTVEQPYQGALAVITNAGTLTAELRGAGTRPKLKFVQSGTLTFAPLQTGQTSAAVEVELKNEGSATATSIALAKPDGYTLSYGTCNSPVTPGASCTFTVSFAPTAAGSYNGTIGATAASPTLAAERAVSGSAQAPAASVPSALDFGDKLVLGSHEASVALRNDGIGPLSFTVPSTTSVTGTGFSFVGTDCVSPLAKDGSCNVQLAFQPQAAGQASGLLKIVTALAGEKSTTLSGKGVRPVLSIQPTGDHNFGEVQTGQTSSELALTITNGGDADATSLSIGDLTGFIVDKSACSGTLTKSGGQCVVKVRFAPQEVRGYDGDIQVLAASPATPVNKRVLGSGKAPSATLGGWPFGDRLIQSSVIATDIWLTNTGVGPLTITSSPVFSIEGSSAFTVNSTECGASLAATGDKCRVSVKFTPGTTGDHVADLKVTTNAGVVKGRLTGKGVAPSLNIQPNPVDMGAHSIDSTKDMDSDILVRNEGEIATGNLTITPPPGFSVIPGIQHDTCTGQSLPADEKQYCRFRLRFSPQQVQSYDGQLRVADATTYTEIQVKGSGLASAPVLTTDLGADYNFGNVNRGVTRTVTYILSNNGYQATGLAFEAVDGASGRATFRLVPAGAGACVTGGTLAAGGNCTIKVEMTTGECSAGSDQGKLFIRGANFSDILRTMSVNVLPQPACSL